MTDAQEHPERAANGERRPGLWRGQPAWKRGLLVLAVVLMVAGLGLGAVGALTESDAPSAPRAPAVDSPLTSSFAGVPSGEAEVSDEPGAPSGFKTWSPSIFRLGFSFFAGFAMAYAVRTFLKIAVLAAGLLLLALFGLQYAGLVDVKWDRMSEHYDVVVGWLGREFSTFKTFITGYLPSAGSGLAGMVIGFRRG